MPVKEFMRLVLTFVHSALRGCYAVFGQGVEIRFTLPERMTEDALRLDWKQAGEAWLSVAQKREGR